MAKTELKTQKTGSSVEEFLASVADKTRREDGLRTLEIFRKATGQEPKMWGPAIVGFGDTQLVYPDGRSIDWMVIGFSPRKQNMTLYVICDSPRQAALLAKLGKHTTSVACLYIKKLADIDEKVLADIVKDAYEFSK